MTHLAPLISVLMPVHNAGIYLAEAVTSILNQKDVLFELTPQIMRLKICLQN